MTAQVFEWVDADGVPTTLSESWDFDGRFMPEPTFSADALPGQDGSIFRSVRFQPRELKITFWVREDCSGGAVGLREQMRALVRAMNPRRGAGKIRITNPGGDQREIECYYRDGLGLPEQYGSTSSRTLQKVSGTWVAFSPFWEAPSPVVSDYVTGDPVPFFPIFPLILSSSEIVVSDTIVNVGDVESWPTWKITGPGSGIVLTLTSVTPQQSLDFGNAGNLTLDVGEWVDVDTSEGIKTVTKNNGTNLFRYLTNDSVFWPIPAGSSTFHLQMTGATTDSTLRLQYTPRYLSP